MKRQLVYIICLIFFANCDDPVAIKQDILAKVGKAELTLNHARASIPDNVLKADSIKAFQEFRDRWIEEQLLLQEANRLGLENNSVIQSQIEKMKKQIIINNFQDLVINASETDNKVSDEDAKLYYQDNKDKFVLSERYIRFRHFIGDTRQNAENARNDLLHGATWEDVLDKYGLYKNLKLHEVESFYPQSIALNEHKTLNRYLSIIGINEISIVERIDNKFHFVQLLEEKAAGEHPDLEWLIPQIQEWLTIEKKKRAYNTYLQNLYLAGKANNEILTFDVKPDKEPVNVEIDTLNIN